MAMKPRVFDDGAFTGLEAAMVFIAFIVVASVFAYVALGAGSFTTQNTEQTVYSAVQHVGSVIQVVEPVMIQASADGQHIRYIVIMIRGPQGSADVDVGKITLTVSTSEVMQTYSGGDRWSPVGGDEHDPIFWTVQIPLYQADDPTIPDDVIIGKNQKFVVEMNSADTVGCAIERRAPPDMQPDRWYAVSS